MFNNIKMYIYGAVAFIISALGVWVKVLSEQKKSLKKDLSSKERELQQTKTRSSELEEVRSVEEEQVEITERGEIEKELANSQVNDILEKSDERDIKVEL